MIKKIFGILSILSAILLSGCTNYNEIDDQRTYIVNYLDGLNVEYEILDNVFRYIEDSTGNNAEYITKGSKFSIYFIGYTFTKYPSQVFFTNIESIALDNFADLDSEYWEFSPLEITLGQTDIIKGLEKGLEGCQYGDIVNIIMTSNYAYGEKGMGIVPENTAITYTVQILDQQ